MTMRTTIQRASPLVLELFQADCNTVLRAATVGVVRRILCSALSGGREGVRKLHQNAVNHPVVGVVTAEEVRWCGQQKHLRIRWCLVPPTFRSRPT